MKYKRPIRSVKDVSILLTWKQSIAINKNMVGETGVNGRPSRRPPEKVSWTGAWVLDPPEKVSGADLYRWNKSLSCILSGVYP